MSYRINLFTKTAYKVNISGILRRLQGKIKKYYASAKYPSGFVIGYEIYRRFMPRHGADCLNLVQILLGKMATTIKEIDHTAGRRQRETLNSATIPSQFILQSGDDYEICLF
ncbi:MAG: hypothetical protein ACK5JN_09380 [Kluyvera sp.]|uniref:hypothetical protein n=1 Tax=Kluyvera sp. TaxID=1538228 RepID=UPI003A873551